VAQTLLSAAPRLISALGALAGTGSRRVSTQQARVRFFILSGVVGADPNACRAGKWGDRMGPQFAFLDEVQLVLPDLFGTEQVRGAMEVGGEPPDGTDVGTCGSLRVITALEFLEYPFS
jgi:hypothetical protein